MPKFTYLVFSQDRSFMQLWVVGNVPRCINTLYIVLYIIGRLFSSHFKIATSHGWRHSRTRPKWEKHACVTRQSPIHHCILYPKGFDFTSNILSLLFSNSLFIVSYPWEKSPFHVLSFLVLKCPNPYIITSQNDVFCQDYFAINFEMSQRGPNKTLHQFTKRPCIEDRTLITPFSYTLRWKLFFLATRSIHQGLRAFELLIRIIKLTENEKLS